MKQKIKTIGKLAALLGLLTLSGCDKNKTTESASKHTGPDAWMYENIGAWPKEKRMKYITEHHSSKIDR